ncbi:methyl-accepting chemotaxis protein [Sporomusa aerivorans]|uniref:methyl-accepting chemotaxis protein n=1 Tax=Sporomusa aerivorans TaxID=204936 RepID=UPI00352BADC5
MSFFNNLKVSLKLSALLLIALLSIGVISYTGYFYLQRANSQFQIMYDERLVPVKFLSEARTYARTMNGAILELMLTKDEKRNQELKTVIEDSTVKVNNILAVIEKQPLDQKSKELLATVKESQQKYYVARSAVVELAIQNKNAEAYSLYVGNVDPLTTKYIDGLVNFGEYYIKLSEQMNSDNKAAEADTVQIMLGLSLLTGIILGLSGLYITKTITTPLGIMVSACQELAAGDFRDKPRQVLRKDEVGELADNLVTMRTSLRNVLKKVNESSEQVAASSEELTASAEQSAQAATMVAESISAVAYGAERQLKAVAEASLVVEQMSAGIQQVAASAAQVAGNSSQAADKARLGDQSVEKAVSQMASIEQTVNNSAQVIAKLGARSKEIGQIVEAISGIAGQTNLLALNAAIEAARAGEQGKGFAVVAEEVRKLAEQSQDAAKQITALISEIQTDTDKAVESMSEGTREVKVGSEVVALAGHSFKEIRTLVTQVSEQVRDISAAFQQMAVGSQQIVSSVKEIDRHSTQAADQSQTVSAATEEQSASMEEIASASHSLAQLAQSLQTAVNHFRL